MTLLHVDFETRSTVDLRKTGVHKYAAHPDTDIWCMSWAFDGDEPETWWPGFPVPLRIVEHVAAGGAIYAHNAEFERVMWREVGRRHGLPVAALEQFYCTAAEAAAMALPRHLEKVAKVLRLKHQKDAAGNRLMLQMCKPRKLDENGRPVWWDDTTKLQRLAEYCRTDVLVERDVYHATRRLGPRERSLYLLDQRINDRGVGLDVPLVRAMRDLARAETDAQDAILREVTEGAVGRATQTARLRTWLVVRGVPTDSVDKQSVRAMLERSDLPDDVIVALEARQAAAKSSIKKLGSMLDTVMDDARMRGLLLYHAASTGRWAGRGPQPHNFPRGEVPDIESYIPGVLDGSIFGAREGPALLTTLSSMLRSCIVPAPGHDLIVSDYSTIELRMVAWLAQEPDLLAALRAGRPIYKEMAADIYELPVDGIEKGTNEYQIGKNTVLGAGYGMGGRRQPDGSPSKFRAMVKQQTGIDITDEFAEKAINMFRTKYPKIPELWKSVNRACLAAVAEPGTVHRAGPVKFKVDGAYLWLVLPSRRALAYFGPRIVERDTPWGTTQPAVEVKHQNQMTKQWERTALYGGLLVENISQALARDVMADGMLGVEAASYPVILTVHDELVSEVPSGFGSVEEYNEIITREPKWAPGLPLAAEGWRGKRYRK